MTPRVQAAASHAVTAAIHSSGERPMFGLKRRRRLAEPTVTRTNQSTTDDTAMNAAVLASVLNASPYPSYGDGGSASCGGYSDSGSSGGCGGD